MRGAALAGDEESAESEAPAQSKHQKPRIVVMGVGGCGLASLTKLADEFNPTRRYADVYGVDTDAEALHYFEELPASHRLLVGKHGCKGLGSGEIAYNGEEAAKEDEARLRDAVRGAVLVYVSCGLGGGTGTGATYHLVKLAKEEGAAVVVQCVFPFMDEGVKRLETAKAGLDRLRGHADKVLIMYNQKLLESRGGRAEAKRAIEDVTANAVKDAVHYAIVALKEKGLKPQEEIAVSKATSPPFAEEKPQAHAHG